MVPSSPASFDATSWLLFLAVLVNQSGRVMVPSLKTSVLADPDFGEPFAAVVGGLLSGVSIVCLGGKLLGAAFTDRLGGWLVLVTVFVMWLAATAGAIAAPTVDVFGYMWLLNSFAYTVTWGAAVQVVGAVYGEKERPAQLSKVASASRFGATLGAPLSRDRDEIRMRFARDHVSTPESIECGRQPLLRPAPLGRLRVAPRHDADGAAAGRRRRRRRRRCSSCHCSRCSGGCCSARAASSHTAARMRAGRAAAALHVQVLHRQRSPRVGRRRRRRRPIGGHTEQGPLPPSTRTLPSTSTPSTGTRSKVLPHRTSPSPPRPRRLHSLATLAQPLPPTTLHPISSEPHPHRTLPSHFECCAGSCPRVRGWRCEGCLALAPPLCVCGECVVLPAYRVP